MGKYYFIKINYYSIFLPPLCNGKKTAPDQRRVIGYAMNEYHTKTCIRFVPRTNQQNYIYIRRDLNVG
jgi:hypothetical protein